MQMRQNPLARDMVIAQCRWDDYIYGSKAYACVWWHYARADCHCANWISPASLILRTVQLSNIKLTEQGVLGRSRFRARKANANKGDFGHVLVIGGSVGKAGAAAMAGVGCACNLALVWSPWLVRNPCCLRRRLRA